MKVIAKIAACSVMLATVISCGSHAEIDGIIKDAPESEIIVRSLNVNVYNVLDTIRTDASGHFRYKAEVKEGDPEFIYLFRNDRKIASLLLSEGDKVKVSADTLGSFEVSGSKEAEAFAGIEKEYAAFVSEFYALGDELAAASDDAGQQSVIKKKIADLYTGYYREKVKYVLSNPHSLTVVPVLFQYAAPDVPVFGQETDAIHFKNLSDSLSSVYPDSRYVKALASEAKRRMNLLSLGAAVRNAEEVYFPDLELPDVKAEKQSLSAVDGDLVMVHFWSAADAAQKMFNLDVLMPLYKDYKDKGFEIYQVSLDTDKALWANTVKNQGLPWINVCDGRGSSSPATVLYNVTKLPVSYFIYKGKLIDEQVSDSETLRRLLDKYLK